MTETGKLRVLDLFSGIGGFSLGLERTGGFETVAFCEIDKFCRAVLKKHWASVPCHKDIRTLAKGDVDGPIDVICGGYPCQPFSTAGKRQGKEDDRHLWPEFSRLVDELRPAWVIGENVAGHISMGLDDVLSDLENKGYTCRTFIIPACAVGAYHRRDRTWVVANSNDLLHSRKLVDRADQISAAASENRNQCEGQEPNGKRLRFEFSASGSLLGDPSCQRCREAGKIEGELSQRTSGTSSTPTYVADAQCIRCDKVVSSIDGRPSEKGSTGETEYSGLSGWWQGWLPEPELGRVADGIPRRVDRLRSLGNAVVPQIPELIGQAILQAREYS